MPDSLRNVAVCFIIALSDETRASDRISIAFATTTVSHRAPSILRHALQTIYGKSIPPLSPQRREARLLCPVSPKKIQPKPGRIIPFARIQRRAILLRGHKGVPFYRYENLAKIKNRLLSLPPPLFLPLLSLFPPLRKGKRKGLKSVGEYVRERAAGGTREKGGWKGRIRYEWNTLRPHFSEDHLLSRHSPLTRSLFRLSLALCFTGGDLSLLLDISFSLLCSSKLSLHVLYSVFAYRGIVRLISQELFDPRIEI